MCLFIWFAGNPTECSVDFEVFCELLSLFTRGHYSRQIHIFDVAVFTPDGLIDASPKGFLSLPGRETRDCRLLGERVHHFTMEPSLKFSITLHVRRSENISKFIAYVV